MTQPKHIGARKQAELVDSRDSEGITWGKLLPPSEGGRYAEVPADATLVWPLLVAGVLERLGVG